MIAKNTKIFIAGHMGMVGSAVWRLLESEGYINLCGKTRKELDLKNQYLVDDFFKEEKPSVVIVAAAIVGGIHANNSFPYKFLMDNLVIQNNLIDAAHKTGCQKFIFLGSSCIYPRISPQPIKEEYLLTGPLEPTNEWYAIAKIAGIKSCEAIRKEFGKDYVSLMPTNLYGPFDNFDYETSHVLPAMIRKFHDAKIKGNLQVKLWGSGTPFREFLHVDDLAKAVLFILKNTLPDPLYNVGTGIDISIKDLALLVQKTVGHQGEVFWDIKKPDGAPKKLLDVSKIKSEGWGASIELEEGVRSTYLWFKDHYSRIKELKFSSNKIL